ncbi:hypothetical protein D3C71_789430 [compost metagenome]
MKKFLIGVLIVIVSIWVIIRIFGYYNSRNIMSNQVVFKVYTDLKEDEIDTFFHIEKGTFDPEKHRIICRLPVTTSGFKPSYQIVQFNQSVNCKEEFNPDIHVKYDNSELNNTGVVLYLINKNMQVITLDSPAANSTIIASQGFSYEYKKGRINHILISRQNVYNYCD